MEERPGFKQTDKQRLSEEAAKLRKEARGTPPGMERDRLIRRAQDTESASQVNGLTAVSATKTSTRGARPSSRNSWYWPVLTT
jgi:hypothetical protein